MASVVACGGGIGSRLAHSVQIAAVILLPREVALGASRPDQSPWTLPSQKGPRLRTLSVAWPFLVVIVAQVLLASFSLQMVASLRSYVTGESLWSKGQHDAIYFLSRYIATGAPQHLARYQAAIALPLGDRSARLDLERQPPRLDAAFAGFLAGGNHPDDIPGIIWLFTDFHWFEYMAAAVERWRRAEGPLLEIVDLSNEIVAVGPGPFSTTAQELWSSRLGELNDTITPLTTEFSRVLGEGSRRVQLLLLIANVALALVLVVLTTWHVRRFLRHRHLIESELLWRANHDELTSLPNRRAFEHRLQAALHEAPLHQSLIFVDLDQFKIVNDTCGHAAGDALLRRVTEALSTTKRQTHMLARLGGDEFAVLLADSSPDEAERNAEHMREALENLGFVWEERLFATSASFGVVHLSQHHSDSQIAMRDADIACYMAKAKGRNRVYVYSSDDEDQERYAGGMSWVHRLQRALDEDRFVLYGQSIVPISQHRDARCHTEVLLRLQDSDCELILPGAFIPSAERFGLMPRLDRWVVQHAFLALASSGSEGSININLSAATIGDATFYQFVFDQLWRNRISGTRVCFEITETTAIANLASATTLMRQLAALGVTFALDDFGAGMSSLRYLRDLPVHYLKVDGAFTKSGLASPSDRAIMKGISQMGKALGKLTVAEFVENSEALAVLRQLGIDYAQGYALDVPAPLDSSLRAADLLAASGR